MFWDAQHVNTVYPVRKLHIYPNNCYAIERTSLLKDSYYNEKARRGKIMELTKQSLVKLIWTINATSVDFKSMITLTYPKQYPTDGKKVKEDLHVFKQFLKRKYGITLLWFLEFQRRGAPHVHILTTADCLTPSMRFEAGIKWSERVCLAPWFVGAFSVFSENGSLMEGDIDDAEYSKACRKVINFNMHLDFWQLEKRPNGLRHYAAKYAGKELQKEVPTKYIEVGRFWGADKSVKPKADIVVDVDEDEVRDWLGGNGHAMSEVPVLPKLLFNVKRSGGESGAT